MPVEKAPGGPGSVHEVKFDGFRMAARIDHSDVQLLTLSGLDWTEKCPQTVAAFTELPVTAADIDSGLCRVDAVGAASFELMQQPSDCGLARSLISPSTFCIPTAPPRPD
jgi:bifunctional non-homologous end joining protein LigD